MGLSFPNSRAAARVSKMYAHVMETMPAPSAVRRGAHRLKSRLPKRIQTLLPSFNFIGVHYAYLVGFSIFGSILLYPAGILTYTDALFFAVGSSTQSGLNTVDLNKMYLYQQIILYLIACLTNPIVINTVVVFIRLYWFERRFKNVVEEAQRVRRSRTRSRSHTELRDPNDPNRIERGVNGRPIRVLHHTTKPNGMSASVAHNASGDLEKAAEAARIKQQVTHTSSDSSAMDDSSSTLPGGDDTNIHLGETFLGTNPALKRDITFADELKPSERKELEAKDPTAEHESTEHHISFLAKQRDKNQSTLRIPGPRDFERGDKPTELPADQVYDEDDPDNPITPRAATFRQTSVTSQNEVGHPNRPKTEITFDEPRRPSKLNGTDEKNAHHGAFGAVSRFARNRAPSLLEGIRERTRSFTHSQSDPNHRDMPYFSWQPTMGRNSAFVDLTSDQREELGGIEYRSLKTLATILICYFIGFHLFGVIILLPWIIRSGTWGPVVDQDGINRAWWSIFTSATLFNDLGFTLTPDSFISFQEAVVPLLLGSFLIIVGNTGFPCMLRLVICTLSKLVPRDSPLWEELRFLLDHPRRCFTLLFPARATWILFGVLVLLNGIDLIFFIILDLNAPVVQHLSAGTKLLDGLFQAVSTRTAGTAVVNLSLLHPAIQVSYLIMMYISVFPIAISVRRTNVYEENSLGVYPGEDEDDTPGKSYVGQHLRRQLSFDLWYVFLGLFIIAIVEGHRIQTNDITLFAILFEIVSAYGTVGLSLGYSTINASLSAEFKILSKLVIIAMMLRGRHRGLPYALDRAILLPSEKLNRKEQEEGVRQLARRSSSVVSGANAGGEPRSPDARRSADMSWPASPTGQGSGAHAIEHGIRSRTRRSSEAGDRKKAPRERRLSNVIMSGLSAGPTLKHD